MGSKKKKCMTSVWRIFFCLKIVINFNKPPKLAVYILQGKRCSKTYKLKRLC